MEHELWYNQRYCTWNSWSTLRNSSWGVVFRKYRITFIAHISMEINTHPCILYAGKYKCVHVGNAYKYKCSFHTCSKKSILKNMTEMRSMESYVRAYMLEKMNYVKNCSIWLFCANIRYLEQFNNILLYWYDIKLQFNRFRGNIIWY